MCKTDDDKNAATVGITRPPSIYSKIGFKQFLYNPETHQVLGRTGKSWAEILLAYLSLYSFLAAFFAALCYIGVQTNADGKPKWTLTDSPIGRGPAFSYRPMTDVIDSTVGMNDTDGAELWTTAVEGFLTPYALNVDIRQLCDYSKNSTQVDKPCSFTVPESEKCNRSNDYGFSEGTPCVYLKMNKVGHFKRKLF